MVTPTNDSKPHKRPSTTRRPSKHPLASNSNSKSQPISTPTSISNPNSYTTALTAANTTLNTSSHLLDSKLLSKETLPTPVTTPNLTSRGLRRFGKNKRGGGYTNTGSAKHSQSRKSGGGMSSGINGEAAAAAETAVSTSNKIARIDLRNGLGLKVTWARFKQRFGTGSALSESLMEAESTDTTTLSASYRSKRGLKNVNGNGFGVSDVGDDDNAREKEKEKDEIVDLVVVDNELGEKGSLTQPSDLGTNDKDPHLVNTSGNPNANTYNNGGGSQYYTSDNTSITHYSTIPRGIVNWIWIVLRWRIWPLISHFFMLRFSDEKAEKSYQKENWFTCKTLSIYSGFFFILNWVLVLGLAVRPFSLADTIFYYGFGTALTLPLPFLSAWDIPHRYPNFYQVYVLVAVWSWALYQTGYMYSCAFYGQYGNPNAVDNCGSRDFLGVFYYNIGLPTLALFGLGQSRFMNLIGSIVFVVSNSVLIAPFHQPWIRNIVDAAFYHLFLLYIHYRRENADRRLFHLREQLKVQFRSTQKAQQNERREADSKRRLTSYVFHEVRVPLNTALLAVQNMDATGAVRKDQGIEWAALSGSLGMMSKVLNDVLDFNRLEAGQFATVDQPYNLHQAIRTMMVPLRLAANARGQHLVVELDKNIDLVSRRASFIAQGKSEAWIEAELLKVPDEEGIVVGDESRLRQIITNLASNAGKFTPAGGEIKIVTKLIHPFPFPSSGLHENENDDNEPDPDPPITIGDKSPVVDSDALAGVIIASRADSAGSGSGEDNKDDIDTEKGATSDHAPLSAHRLAQHDGPINRIAVRIEIHDTGVGIRAKELVDNRLFSPYVQTEIGRFQGGKGTGLGLAIVRRIVKLSGGRLGVRSKLNAGSEFWVELPFGVGEKANANSISTNDYAYTKSISGGSDSSGKLQKNTSTPYKNTDFLYAPVAASEGVTPSTLADENENENEKRVSLAQVAPHEDALLKMAMEQRGFYELYPPQFYSSSANGTGNGNGGRGGGGVVGVMHDVFENGKIPMQMEQQRVRVRRGQDEDRDDDNVAHVQVMDVPDTPFSQSSTIISTPSAMIAQPQMQMPTTKITLTRAPRSPSTTPQSPMQTKSLTEAGETALRALIVDDDIVTRKLMGNMLKRLGVVAELAENGKIAYEKMVLKSVVKNVNNSNGIGGDLNGNGGKGDTGMSDDREVEEGSSGSSSHAHEVVQRQQVEEEPYDVVFLDNQMPIMSGLELVAKIRERGRNDFIVGVTGNALLSDQQEYLDYGADHVLTKPVYEPNIRSMLSQALERRRRKQRAAQESIIQNSNGTITQDDVR